MAAEHAQPLQSVSVDNQMMRKRPRYGILGGTFDPPHIGHLALAQEAHARLGLERIWFVPAGQPPHKAGRSISPAADRRAMVELAIAGDERFALSTVELERPGPSYTVETLGALRMAWGADAHICLIIGWDMLAFLPKWRDPEGVLAAIDQLVVAHRGGLRVEANDLERLNAQLPALATRLTLIPFPQLELAATELRDRVAQGLPIRYLVSDAVERYIRQRGLYHAGVGDATTTAIQP